MISIVTPTKNAEKTIRRNINSILMQTLSPIEHIIVDGLSSDNTIGIIKSYEKQYEEKGIKLVIISERDNGIYEAMNKGISLSRGSVIGILNADDEYCVYTISKVNEIFTKEKIDVVHGYLIKRVQLVNSPGVYQDELSITHHMNLGKCMIAHPTCFVRRVMYQMYNYFDNNYRTAADYDFMLKLYFHKHFFRLIKEPLAVFYHGGITTQKYNPHHVAETVNIRKKYNCIGECQYLYLHCKNILKRLIYGVRKC